MPTTTKESSGLNVVTISSDVTVIGTTTITLDVDDGTLRHWDVGAEFYSDSGGTTVVDPTAGTMTPTVAPVALPSQFAALGMNAVTVTAAQNTVEQFSAHAAQIRGVIATVSGGGVTHWRLRAVGTQL